MAAGLPGLRKEDDREVDRENRKRRRKGLPPVEGRVTSSAGGWDEPETPAPLSGSLAEQFIQQRKRKATPVEEPTAEHDWPPEIPDEDGD
jgi:hypothetical protein